MINQSFPQMQAYILFINGPLAHQSFSIGEQGTSIGSDSQCQISIPDSSLQPWHALLAWKNGEIVIQNSLQKSLVTVNQQSIAGETVLQDRDVVSLGQTGISFRLLLSTTAQVQDSTMHKQLVGSAASQQSGSHAQSYKGFGPSSQGTSVSAQPTETTRYLCAAAQFDESFRRYVFKNIVNEEHKALGEAYGVDIIPVVKWSFVAQRRAFIRNIILLMLFLAILWFTLTTPSFLLNLFRLPFTSFNPLGSSNTYTPGISANSPDTTVLSTLVPAAISILVFLVIFFVQFLVITLVIAISRLVLRSVRLSTLYLIAYFFFYPVTFLPLYLLAWIVVTAERAITYYGTQTKRLIKGNFVADVPEVQLNADMERRLRENFNQQGGNVIVYSQYSPFAGAGYDVGRWSFAVDITKGKQEMGNTAVPVSFRVSEMYAHIAATIEALDLSGPSNIRVEDRLYVNGQEIRNDQNFLAQPFSRPRTYADPAFMAYFMENPTEDIRYYKCIRITSWRGEMVLSIFFRLKLAGKNLFIETDYLLLPPLEEEYYQIDTVGSVLSFRKLWALARRTFLPTFSFLLFSPVRVYSWILRDWLVEREHKRVRSAIKDNLAFDYGTGTSLREAASSSAYRRFFQRLDHEMYVKIIERQLLDSIVVFLDMHNIDTTDLKEREERILNNGVIVTGGSFMGASIAGGQSAQATTSNTAQGTGGTTNK